MVDDIKNIDRPLKPLFQTPALTKVREVSKRPEEDREGRDTYSESDELLLSTEAQRLKRNKARHKKPGDDKAKEAGKKGPQAEAPDMAAKAAKAAKDAKDADSDTEQQGGEQSSAKKHLDVVA